MYGISSVLTVQGTAVPEPTSLVMLAIGVFGLLGSDLLICGILIWSQVRRFGHTGDRVDES